jgi:hypothetical protein
VDNEVVTGKDIKNIFEQNNYTNKYLQTIGKYLVSKSTPLAASASPKSTESLASSVLLFKPYKIPNTFAKELQIHQSKNSSQLTKL